MKNISRIKFKLNQQHCASWKHIFQETRKNKLAIKKVNRFTIHGLMFFFGESFLYLLKLLPNALIALVGKIILKQCENLTENQDQKE